MLAYTFLVALVLSPFTSEAVDPQSCASSDGVDCNTEDAVVLPLDLMQKKLSLESLAATNQASGCSELPPPSSVSTAGLISNGGMWNHPDASALPDDCLPTFFSGNTDIFQVADHCCTAEVGSSEWIPFDTFSSGGKVGDAVWTAVSGIEGCMALDPQGPGGPHAVIVNGCYDDGTQFYGEKCGGSIFGPFSSFAYGACGEAAESCGCKHYMKSASTGCYAIAAPPPADGAVQAAVFAKFEGCSPP